MAKGNKRRGRRKHGDSSSEDGEANEEQPKDEANLDFAQRREMRQKAAAEKRRAKSKCHLCGQTGHVRRECPGVDDGGRGASKFTKSKGDPGASTLKASTTKGAKNRGRKPIKKDATSESDFPPLPPGFSAEQQEGDEEPFVYYDATCDIDATIEYLRFGRGKNKLSTNEAVALYQSAIQSSMSSSNYGGCISRSPLLKPNRPWAKPTSITLSEQQQEWFVVGLGRDFLYNDEEKDAGLACLLETLAENDCIVGFVADLDYSPDTTIRPGCNRESQLLRLECTCQAAAKAGITIQIRTSPGVSSTTTSGNGEASPYDAVMKDLQQVLSKAIAQHPELQVHLSCWSGGANDMNALLKEFPDNLWIGFDSTVTFAKASQIHECAFDVPLSRLLLETGDKSIPSIVAKTMGRNAFSHSGLVPFIAEAVAENKRNTTAQQIARAASENTLKLYPQLLPVVVEDKVELEKEKEC